VRLQAGRSRSTERTWTFTAAYSEGSFGGRATPRPAWSVIAYANGIATDITENVQEAFADVLGARPACISY